MINQHLFTETEKELLHLLGNKYTWISRNKNGELYVHPLNPTSNSVSYCRFPYDNLFSTVTYEHGPVQFRPMDILTAKEREYLSYVLKPLPSVKYIVKTNLIITSQCHISVTFFNGDKMFFPDFNILKPIYVGMEPGVEYSPNVLGLSLN